MTERKTRGHKASYNRANDVSETPMSNDDANVSDAGVLESVLKATADLTDYDTRDFEAQYATSNNVLLAGLTGVTSFNTSDANTVFAPNLETNFYSPKGSILLPKVYKFIRSTFKWLFKLTVFGFAAIGLIFTGVFIGMRLGLFNVRGSITERNSFYGALAKVQVPAKTTITTPTTTVSCTDTSYDCAWAGSPEWTTVSAGLTKDASVIDQAANQTGVSPRMIAAAIAPEQLRFFTSEREVFESYFQPLKILGSMSEFSLGVGGMKQQTASMIEQYASDPTSPFYPGSGYQNLFTYPPGQSVTSVQYDRLTSNDHYYDYLYAGLLIKEIESQWLNAGYDVTQRPDVVTTLYNIGLDHSQPKPDPQAGGTPITLSGDTYSFGGLGTLFYSSNQLTSLFPVTTSPATTTTTTTN